MAVSIYHTVSDQVFQLHNLIQSIIFENGLPEEAETEIGFVCDCGLDQIFDFNFLTFRHSRFQVVKLEKRPGIVRVHFILKQLLHFFFWTKILWNGFKHFVNIGKMLSFNSKFIKFLE